MFAPQAQFISRVFQVLLGDGSTATCFTIEHDETQYLVTAAHVVEGQDLTQLRVFKDGEAYDPGVSLVGVSEPPTDIAVLRPVRDVSQRLPTRIGIGNLVYGGDAMFLGYPFGMRGLALPGGSGLPFVKRGVISNLVGASSTRAFSELYLDAIGNRGFSGGPVIVLTSKNEQQLAAVVSSYLKDRQDLEEGVGRYHHNSGLVSCYPIEFAIELIEEADG